MSAKRVRRISTRVTKRVINYMSELKFHTRVLFNSHNVQNTWSFNSAVIGLAQGNTDTTRIGNKIFVKRIEVSIFIQPGQVATNGSVCRFVMWKRDIAYGAMTAPAAQPSYDNFFDSDNLNSLRNITQSRYNHILKDQTFQMAVLSQNAGVNYSLSPPVRLVWRIPVNKNIEYLSGAITTAALQGYDYGVACVADDNNCCQFTVTSKMIFIDP